MRCLRMLFATMPLMALLIVGNPVMAWPVVTEPYPFVRQLTVDTAQIKARVVVENCEFASSGTGSFAIPRRRSESNLLALLCEGTQGGKRLLVFSATNLDLLFDHIGSLDMQVHLLPQGLQIVDGAQHLIWDAPDGDIGSERFREANASASGLRLSPGEVLAPGLSANNYVISADPQAPLYLGPALDAPFFARASSHLLVHLPDENTDFWRPSGFARVCIPDGGCGYLAEHQLRQVTLLDDNKLAVELMSKAFGSRSEKLGCWVYEQEDGATYCLRPQIMFDGVGTKRQGRLLVAAGMGFEEDGMLARCHACRSAFSLVYQDGKQVQVMSPHGLGSWGRGPVADDIQLVRRHSSDWQLTVREAYYGQDGLSEQQHVFGLRDGELSRLHHDALGNQVPREQVTSGVYQELLKVRSQPELTEVLHVTSVQFVPKDRVYRVSFIEKAAQINAPSTIAACFINAMKRNQAVEVRFKAFSMQAVSCVPKSEFSATP